MTKHSGDADQAHRLQQVDKTHLHTKALHDLAAEAVKYHDKYMDAMERLMSCLLDNSDCMEEMRKRYGEDESNSGGPIPPTYEVTGAVAGAFNNFKSSVQVKALRDSLNKLADCSTIAKRNAKVSRSKIEEFDAAAKKNAKRNTEETQQKLAAAKGKKREKLLQEQQAEERRMANLNAAVEASIQSLCSWWAEQLAGQAEDLYRAHRDVGSYLARCYADTTQTAAPPPSTLPQRAPLFVPRGGSVGSAMGMAGPVSRDDTPSYVGVSDYLTTPESQLPPTARRSDGYGGANATMPAAAAYHSPTPAELYAPVCKEPAPMPGAASSDGSSTRGHSTA